MPTPNQRRGGSGLPRFYTIKTVADHLEVSPRTVRRWIAIGDLTSTGSMVSSGSRKPIYGRF